MEFQGITIIPWPVSLK